MHRPAPCHITLTQVQPSNSHLITCSEYHIAHQVLTHALAPVWCRTITARAPAAAHILSASVQVLIRIWAGPRIVQRTVL